jgi:hypothetical protein
MYQLLLTQEDKTAILNIINMTSFKGQDVEYVSNLKERIVRAPTVASSPIEGHPVDGGQT